LAGSSAIDAGHDVGAHGVSRRFEGTKRLYGGLPPPPDLSPLTPLSWAVPPSIGRPPGKEGRRAGTGTSSSLRRLICTLFSQAAPLASNALDPRVRTEGHNATAELLAAVKLGYAHTARSLRVVHETDWKVAGWSSSEDEDGSDGRRR
jgi:hypothetical protein